MNEERSRGKYTLEFKQEAVRHVKAGRAASVVAKTLGMRKACLTNWVRADAKGQLGMTSRWQACAGGHAGASGDCAAEGGGGQMN